MLPSKDAFWEGERVLQQKAGAQTPEKKPDSQAGLVEGKFLPASQTQAGKAEQVSFPNSITREERKEPFLEQKQGEPEGRRLFFSQNTYLG